MVFWWAQINKYIIALWSHSFVALHTTSSSSLRRRIWRYWTWNACQVHSVECVSKIKLILSMIFHAIYGAVCIQLIYFHLSYDYCENVHTLSHQRHQIGSMSYLPLFMVRSWNNGMCCMYFYILVPYYISNRWSSVNSGREDCFLVKLYSIISFPAKEPFQHTHGLLSSLHLEKFRKEIKKKYRKFVKNVAVTTAEKHFCGMWVWLSQWLNFI